MRSIFKVQLAVPTLDWKEVGTGQESRGIKLDQVSFLIALKASHLHQHWLKPSVYVSLSQTALNTLSSRATVLVIFEISGPRIRPGA